MTRKTRILFLTDDREDYLADSLLHGLISLNDCNVIDYPRKDSLYASTFPLETREKLYGKGFTLYGLLGERSVQRSQIWWRLESGYFDIVIVGNIWRQFGLLRMLQRSVDRCSTKVDLVILDGDDDPRVYLYSMARIREFGFWGWHRVYRSFSRVLYLKRELVHDNLQQWRELMIPRDMRMNVRKSLLPTQLEYAGITFSIPDVWVKTPCMEKKRQLFQSHIVDEEVVKTFSVGACSYVFSEQEEYMDDISKAYYGITTKRSGWDCLRHYEIAASGTVPCFRQLAMKNVETAPHGLHSGNCIAYRDAHELRLIIQGMGAARYRSMLLESHKWVKEYTTKSSAKRILAKILG